MIIAVMQPYFLPYIGYFQLIKAVDLFIVCDNLQYVKQGWINRNRMLMNGHGRLFTLPLQKASSFADISGRSLAQSFSRDDLLRLFRVAYRKAPFFNETYPLLEAIIRDREQNLFHFVHGSLVTMCAHLGITTEIRMLSTVPIDHSLRRHEKLFALCDAVGADAYINAIGGTGYFSHADFAGRGIKLMYLKSRPLNYKQFADLFIPWLSIADVLMFNPQEAVRQAVSSNYDLV